MSQFMIKLKQMGLMRFFLMIFQFSMEAITRDEHRFFCQVMPDLQNIFYEIFHQSADESSNKNGVGVKTNIKFSKM